MEEDVNNWPNNEKIVDDRFEAFFERLPVIRKQKRTLVIKLNERRRSKSV